MVKVSDAREVQEDERELEGTPALVLRISVDLNQRRRLLPLPADAEREDGMNALMPHRPIGESKGVRRLWIRLEQRYALADSLARLTACAQRPREDVLVPRE